MSNRSRTRTDPTAELRELRARVAELERQLLAGRGNPDGSDEHPLPVPSQPSYPLVAVVDRGGVVVAAWSHPHDSARYGIEGRDLRGSCISDGLPQEQVQKLAKKLREAVEQDEPRRIRLSTVFPGGNFDFDVILSPIYARTGQTPGVVVIYRDVTAKQRVADATFATDSSSSVSETHQSPVTLIDREGVILSFWSHPGREDSSTIQPFALRGKRLPEFTGSKQAEEVLAVVREVYATGEVRHDPRSFRLPAAELHEDTWYSPVFDASGAVQAVLSVSRHVGAEQPGRDTRRVFLDYQDLYESAPDMYVSLDPQTGAIVACNQTVATVLGYTKEEIHGKPVFELYHPDCLERAQEAFRSFVETGEAHADSLQVKRKDGSTLDVSLRVSSVRDERGRILHSRSVWRDVTDVKRVENALRESEQYLRKVLASLEDMPIVLLDRDARINKIFHKEEISERHGMSQSQLLGKRLSEFIGLEGGEAYARLVREVFDTGEPRATKRWTSLPAGDACFDARLLPILDASGEVDSVLAVGHDVTQREHAEAELVQHRDHLQQLVAERTAELERSQEDLRRSERLAAIGTFAAGIAHQINNPVGSILLAAQYALDVEDNPIRTRAALLEIAEDSRRCGRIVRGVLRFAREQVWDKRPANFNEVIRSAVAALRQRGEEACPSIDLQLAADLPVICLSETAMGEVVSNLVSNAAEAGSERVLVRTERTAGGVCLVVEDDGRGITESTQSRVFDPFYTSHPDSGGTGIGLSIVHSIVEDHHGEIRVASEPGGGTTITLNFPR